MTVRATRRTLRTADVEALVDPKERLRELNAILQSVHYGHNEVRRLVPLILNAITEVVAPEKKPSPPKDA